MSDAKRPLPPKKEGEDKPCGFVSCLAGPFRTTIVPKAPEQPRRGRRDCGDCQTTYPYGGGKRYLCTKPGTCPNT